MSPLVYPILFFVFFFFFNDTATTEIYTLSLHDALPISTDGEPSGGEHVPLLAVRIRDEGDPRRPVGIVLDGGHLPRHPELVATEVDAAEPPLVAPTLVPGGDVALVVSAAGPSQRLEQRALGLLSRHVGEVRDRPEAGRRRHRLELADAHISPRRSGSCRRP